MSELKPCPFCGGKARVMQYGELEHLPTCNACDCILDYCFYSEEEAIAAWNRRTKPDITGETSDGYHTFNELYHHRAVLFSVICNARPEMAWKSKKHYDGTMYDGMFIVGINTPDGQATYHYDVEPYWDMFRVQDLTQAPEWDGHTPAQAIERIGRLRTKPDQFPGATKLMPNEPLTIDDIKTLDYEPIWVEDISGCNTSCWAIAGRTRGSGIELYDEHCGEHYIDFAAWDNYGKTWVAYRRKPELEGGEGDVHT